jgi:ribonuclease R
MRESNVSRTITDQAVLAHISALPHGRATYKQLVKEFQVHGDERERLEEALERLSGKGYLIELRSGHFLAIGASKEYVTGKLSQHRDGYGFVIPEQKAGEISGDVFLPPEEARKAMHGDRVLVHVSRIQHQGKADGEVVRILSRAHASVVGEFRIKKRGNFVIPADDRIRQWIEIPEGMALPEHSPARDRVGTAIRVAKTVEDLDGMIVNVDILEFPDGDECGVGRVTEVLGFPDDFGVDVEISIRKHHLPHEFSDEVLAEARTIVETPDAGEIQRRRDFRHLDIVTIDGETARDFDDAVWLERLDAGNWALQVHIADVSHYVRPGSAIDVEAQLRGTSVYFPDRAVPMLPVELSTDICSLRPGLDRLVFSVLLEFDPQGERVGQEFVRGVIRSAERMTYTNVFRVLEGDPGMRERYSTLVSRFELMRELALLLNRQRVKRGSIDFDMPETQIEFDAEGQMTGVRRAERNIAHRLIEEFMLAANEAVAGYLEENACPSLYRIHELPDPKRVAEFEEIAAHFGYSLGIGAMPVKRFAMVTRHRDGRKTQRQIEMADSGFSISPRNYQRLIAKIAGKPEERILSYLMLRSLKQARYSSENVGHFALAAKSYTHFTSPIRRYPDLVVHRVLSRFLENRESALEEKALRELGEDCSFTERRAAEAERDLVEWKKVKFMEDRVGEEFGALIISITKFGFFVELEDLFVEGLVPISTLPGDRYAFQENQRRIVGERTRKVYATGDAVKVVLDRVDMVEKKMQFAVIEPERKKRKK